jgi:hypothetical protein
VWGGLGVREVVSSGALVDIDQRKKKKTFHFVLGVVGAVFDICGTSQPPRCCTGHPFGWGVCLWQFPSEFRWGGVGTYFECIWGFPT